MNETELNKLIDTLTVKRDIPNRICLGLDLLTAQDCQIYADHDMLFVEILRKSLDELSTNKIASLIALGWFPDFGEDSWCHFA